jgi:hypothetical protein
MDEGQKLGGQQAAVTLSRIRIRLGMVNMNFLDTTGRDILLKKLVSATDGKTDVFQSSLISPPCGITDNHRKYIDPDMVHLWPTNGTSQKKPTVSAADV